MPRPQERTGVEPVTSGLHRRTDAYYGTVATLFHAGRETRDEFSAVASSQGDGLNAKEVR
jgi:hypothetical protein